MSVLARAGAWPVGSVAAAVVGTQGVLESFGDVERRFALASVTKPLSALTALVAVEEEAVRLDDPVLVDVVPGATVRHLLAHASGLAADRLVRAVQPQTRRIYSNAGIDAMASHVVGATGIEFDEYFAEALAGPLRLSATTLGMYPSRDGISTCADLARVLAELICPSGLLHASTRPRPPRCSLPGCAASFPDSVRRNATTGAWASRSERPSRRTGRVARTPRTPTATSDSPEQCCGWTRWRAWASSR